IKIKDNGCGIDNIKMAMTPLFTTAKNDERAGLGFAVMESFMDKVKVYSDTGKGTSVIMTKKLNSRDFYD
ncbi:MAG: ATP-binding protein, partial [Oscillospiraceae bacterium]